MHTHTHSQAMAETCSQNVFVKAHRRERVDTLSTCPYIVHCKLVYYNILISSRVNLHVIPKLANDATNSRQQFSLRCVVFVVLFGLFFFRISCRYSFETQLAYAPDSEETRLATISGLDTLASRSLIYIRQN